MTSLPTLSPGFEDAVNSSALLLATRAPQPASVGAGAAVSDDEQFLLRAFRSFAEAADSLERSYGKLRAEVERLRRELAQSNRELEQSNSELALSLEENRGMRENLDRILEGLPCGVLVVSESGDLSRANPEAVRLLLASPAAPDSEAHESFPLMPLPAMPVTSMALPAAPLPPLPLYIRELLDSARRHGGEQELSIPEPAGAPRWLAARHASIAGGASVFILRDVSERKRFEAAEEKMRREQALAEMSAVLAHEIRNPLASLELFAGLLAESPLDGEGRGWISHIQAGLRTLAATVNNVLHFHGVPEPLRAPVDLGRLLNWARDFFRPLGQQAHIAFSLQNRLEGICVSADRHRLEQVLLNLVLNAVRAMPAGGWIELGGWMAGDGEDGKTVILTVSDTGPGIAPAYLSRVFDPGFSTRAGSPGLGLAVCRKIIEQHGGSVAASTRAGCGAVFTVRLPLALEANEHSAQHSTQQAARRDQ